VGGGRASAVYVHDYVCGQRRDLGPMQNITEQATGSDIMCRINRTRYLVNVTETIKQQ
jgi:hypothetical protein